MVEDEDGIVTLAAQAAGQGQPAAQVGRPQQVTRPVESELVEEDDLVDQVGRQDGRAVGGGQNVHRVARLGGSQASQGGGDGQQIADVGQLDDQPLMRGRVHGSLRQGAPSASDGDCFA